MGKVFIYSPISISLSPRDTSTYCPVSAISSSKASSNEYENFALISFLIISYKFHHPSKSNFMYLFFHPVTPDNFTRIILNIKKRTQDRKSTRLNSSHVASSYAVFCLQITIVLHSESFINFHIGFVRINSFDQYTRVFPAFQNIIHLFDGVHRLIIDFGDDKSFLDIRMIHE